MTTLQYKSPAQVSDVFTTTITRSLKKCEYAPIQMHIAGRVHGSFAKNSFRRKMGIGELSDLNEKMETFQNTPKIIESK